MLEDFEIVISKEEISARLKTLAMEIEEAFKNIDKEKICAIWLAEGAFIFAADLLREIKFPIRIHSLKISSYGGKESPDSLPTLRENFNLDLKGMSVLLIDDVLDCGKTAQKVFSLLKDAGAENVRSCFLLDKEKSPNFKPDFVGFKISDRFVIGYGLDFCFNARNLPHIYAKKPQ